MHRYRTITCAIGCVNEGGNKMNTIVIVVMGVMLLSALPLWPYSANGGYLPVVGWVSSY